MKHEQRAFSSSLVKALTEDVSFAFASSILRMTDLLLFVCGDQCHRSDKEKNVSLLGIERLFVFTQRPDCRVKLIIHSLRCSLACTNSRTQRIVNELRYTVNSVSERDVNKRNQSFITF
jgi:hypothetical protein